MKKGDKDVTNPSKSDPDATMPGGNTVRVQFEDGIAWVIMNRPEKRNAMSPTMNKEMLEVLDALEDDEVCRRKSSQILLMVVQFRFM